MFAGLHDIDWPSLHHAYGAADEVPGLLLALASSDADEREKAWTRDAADILGEIGPVAAEALPRLRELMTNRYPWIRVHAAAAVWRIAGEGETRVVVEVLVQAWAENRSTNTFVMEQLGRMAPAVAMALPQLHDQIARARQDNDHPWGVDVDTDERVRQAVRRFTAQFAEDSCSASVRPAGRVRSRPPARKHPHIDHEAPGSSSA